MRCTTPARFVSGILCSSLQSLLHLRLACWPAPAVLALAATISGLRAAGRSGRYRIRHRNGHPRQRHRAADSAAPITVIGADALGHVGQPNLIQTLAQLSPSFTAEARGGDTGNLTLSARLRGVSPNDTLVLVDGKRRHSSANLHVGSGQFQGAATTDLDLIPVSASTISRCWRRAPRPNMAPTPSPASSTSS